MSFELLMTQGLEHNKYSYKTLKECCEHIQKMLILAIKVGWNLTFEIYVKDQEGNSNFLNWQIACLGCLGQHLGRY